MKAKYAEFSARLKEAMRDKGFISKQGQYEEDSVDYKAISKVAKVTSMAAWNYVAGENMPRDPKLKEIAAFLEVSFQWLKYGTGPKKFIPQFESSHHLIKFIPLLEWSDASTWIEEYSKSEGKKFELVPSLTEVGEKAFALMILGVAMQSSSTSESFGPGTKIIVDPDLEPNDGDYVIAHFQGSPEVTFKQLIIDRGAGRSYLQNLNPLFQRDPIEINKSCKIIGVVRASFKIFK